MKWAKHAARLEERLGVYRVLVEKREGKISLGTPKHRGEDNIKVNTQDVERGSVYWTDVVLDGDKSQAVVKMVMNSRVP